MPRRLRPDEEALWQAAMARATPLTKHRKPAAPPQTSTAPAPDRALPPSLPKFRIGERAVPQPEPPPPKHRRRIDKRTHTRLRRGKLLPEARLDLHGMTLGRAHNALNGFILRASAEGQRLVLVITGKGGGGWSPEGERGVLRRQVPEWLTMPPLSPLVQDVLPAHRSHGGDGALYVWLRRR